MPNPAGAEPRRSFGSLGIAVAASLALHLGLLAAAGLFDVHTDPPEPAENPKPVDVEVIVQIPAKMMDLVQPEPVGLKGERAPGSPGQAAPAPAAPAEKAPALPAMAAATVSAAPARTAPAPPQAPRPPTPEQARPATERTDLGQAETIAAAAVAGPPAPARASAPSARPAASTHRGQAVVARAPAAAEPNQAPEAEVVSAPMGESGSGPQPAAALSPAPAESQGAAQVSATLQRKPLAAGRVDRPGGASVAQAPERLPPTPSAAPPKATGPAPAAPIAASDPDLLRAASPAPAPERIPPSPARLPQTPEPQSVAVGSAVDEALVASTSDPLPAQQADPAPLAAAERLPIETSAVVPPVVQAAAAIGPAGPAAAAGSAPSATAAVATAPLATARPAREDAPLAASSVPTAATAASAGQALAPEASIEMATAAAQVEPETPPSDPSPQIEATVQSFGCARISSRYQAANGAVVVAGHVPSSADRASLVESLSAIPGVSDVDESELYIVQEPYCRVLAFLSQADLLRSDQQRADSADLGDPVQSGVRQLSSGELLKLQLKSPDFASHIYVDYFSVDGQVHHLMPTEQPGENFFPARAQLGIGGENDPGGKIVIGPPFGLDMVVAIGSSHPLFETPRAVSEPAAPYLEDLTAAISRVRAVEQDLRIEYVYHLIFTTGPPRS